MKRLKEKIKSLITFSDSDLPRQTTSSFDFVKSKKGILRELILSKESGNVIGVYCKAIGEGLFLLSVERIENSVKNETIIFHRYDVSGRQLSRNNVQLDDIEMVCPFSRVYQQPIPSQGGVREKSNNYINPSTASA